MGKLDRRMTQRLAVAIAMAAAPLLGCFPQLPLGTPGHKDYQASSLIEVSGGFFNPASRNFRVEHEAFTLDSVAGPRKAFKLSYNSAPFVDAAGKPSWKWHGNWEISYDGTIFVDPLGTVHDVQSVPDGTAVKGTFWVRVDADTMRTKGGATYHFDALGRLQSETLSLDSFPQLSYVWNGASVTVEECVSLSQQTSGSCRLMATIEWVQSDTLEIVDEVSSQPGDPRKAIYVYNEQGMLVQAKTPQQLAMGNPGTLYEYGTGSLLKAQVFPEGERTEYTYAQTHLLSVLEVGEENPETRFEYYGGDNGEYSVVHLSPGVAAERGETRYTVNANDEVLEIERLSLAVPEVTTFEWHAGLRRPSQVTAPDGSMREFPVWVDDDPVEIVEASGNRVFLTYEPDGVNYFGEIFERPVAEIADEIAGPGTQTPVLTIVYDPVTGLPESETNGEGETTAYEYLNGSLIKVTSPSGDVVDFVNFGSSGHWQKLVSSAVPEFTVRRKFDATGNPTVPAAGLQLGGVLEEAYDHDRRLASIEVAGTDQDGLVTTTDTVSISLRADGRQLVIARPLGANTEFGYDGLGRTTSMCERVLGVCATTTLEYNAAGLETAVERPNGMRQEFDYDPYGRVIAHRALQDGVLEGEATVVWQDGRIVSNHDTVRADTSTVQYDAAGRVRRVDYALKGESQLFGYDARSRLTSETLVTPSPLPLGDPIVLAIGYEYDLADRLVEMFLIDGSPEGELLREWVYLDGRLIEVRDGNGNVRETLFDAQTNRVNGYRMTDGLGVEVEATSITRSVELAPTRFQQATSTTTALATTAEEYWLNKPGCLSDPDCKVGMRVFRAQGWDDGVPMHDRRFSWDPLSNLVDNASGDTFTYNADRTRLLSASGTGWSHAYQYDEAGFVIDRDGLELARNAIGRVTRVGPAASPLAEATWDVSGGLVSATLDGETRDFTYFGGRVEEDTISGGPGWIHVQGVSLPFIGTERRFRHADFRGNAVVVADESGQIVSHRRYNAFGLDRVHGTSGSGGSSMLEQIVLSGFAGGAASQDLGLSFNGARVLDMDTGRFLSPDPLHQILNQASYANGNPISFEDADGRQATPNSGGPSGTQVATTVSAVGFAGVALANLLVQVAAFNAAGVGAASLTATATAVTAASLPLGIAVAAFVFATVGAVALVVDALQASQEAIDSQPKANPFQKKQLELEAGELQALQALLKLGLTSIAVGKQAPRRASPSINAPEIGGLDFNLGCAPLRSLRTARGGLTLWLQLGALGALSAVLIVLRALSPTRFVWKPEEVIG